MKKNAKTVSAIIIATLLSITLLMSAGEVKADFQRDWSATVGFPVPDYYSECDHTDWQYSDDCVALLGMTAQYDLNYQYAYNYITWNWNAQVGYGYQHDYYFYGNPHCLGQIMPINTQSYQTFFSVDDTNSPSYDSLGEYVKAETLSEWWAGRLTSINGISSSYFYQVSNPSHVIYVAAGPGGSHYRVMTASGDSTNSGESAIEVSPLADVSATPTQSYTIHTNPTISWVCADDWGSYYCYVSSVYIYGMSGQLYDQLGYCGNTGSYPFYDISTPYHIVINSEPYYYPVTFNAYAHNDNYGDTLVNSWTEWHVAWEEGGGRHYSHGSDVHGGGGENYYVDSAIDDPWGQGTDYFNYAMAHNWGGGSESYYYGIPMNVYTYVWGNTVDIYYNWQEYGMNGISSKTPLNDTGITNTSATLTPAYPVGFTSPASTPYIYNSTTNSYVPVRYP